MTEDEAVSHIGDDFSAEYGFYSHLPLVVIDTRGIELIPSRSSGYLEGVELSVMDQGLGNNRLSDEPVFRSFIRIRMKDGDNKKGHFSFTLTESSGAETEMPLLGMNSGSGWILNGSIRDSSLMRNYLAYCLAGELMPDTPNTRFCEVFFREGEKYHYQGVFLLNEDVRPAAVLGNFSRKRDNKTSKEYIVLRDRNTANGFMLDTWGYRQGIIDSRLSLIYPKENNIEAGRFIEINMDKAEKIIYSEEHKVFARYSDIIDIKSFVDYFVLSEFLQNYNAGFESTYMYVNSKGKIKLGLVWDSDCILGNNYPESFNPLNITVQNAPLFEQLTRDINFLNHLKSRYSELRRSFLAEDEVIRLIDETAAYLGPAQIRDWKRWAREYSGTAELVFPQPGPLGTEEIPVRINSVTFDQELIKMKYLSVLHANILGDSLHRMGWKENLFDSSYNTRSSTVLLVLFCFLYVAAVYIGRYH